MADDRKVLEQESEQIAQDWLTDPSMVAPLVAIPLVYRRQARDLFQLEEMLREDGELAMANDVDLFLDEVRLSDDVATLSFMLGEEEDDPVRDQTEEAVYDALNTVSSRVGVVGPRAS